MITQKKKFSRKLILLVFSTSFLLIIGSFIYFYLFGKNYIENSAKSELELYQNHFENASLKQIEEYNNEINGSFFNFRIDETGSKQQIINFLELNKGIIDEFYILNKKNNKVTVIIPVIVFSGEQIINFNNFEIAKYQSLKEQIKLIQKFNESSNYGFVSNNTFKDYYIQKDLGEYCLITKLNKVHLFSKVIERIYHPQNIKFHIVNAEEVIEFSTDMFWVKQKLEKFLYSEISTNNIFKDYDKQIIYGMWQSRIFDSTLLLTNNISNLQNKFESITYKLLLYSVIIFLIIVVSTLLYTNKISKSLNKISYVSKLVGEGNFNNKINLKRDDELGLLIDSFNKMVDNLKASYEEISFTNIELEKKIEELVRTKTELTKKEKLALIGETISKISHEIQNKISGVSVWVQNLEMQPELDENTKMYVGEIKRSLNSFLEMLLNFKKFYRKPYLEKSQCDLNEIIINIISNYSADIKAKRLNIVTNLSNQQKRIFADKILLEEVVMNLFVNAIYFSPEEGNIIISSFVEKGDIVFTVIDEGKGISTNEIENILNPFFTTKSSGSGLGLAISKNIIDAHEGKIFADNLEKGGVKFTIILPIFIK